MSGLVGGSVPAFTARASEVKSYGLQIQSSTTRTTFVTPTSGKRIRVISAFVGFEAQVSMGSELYFGTGTNIDSDVNKSVAHWRAIGSGTNNATSDYSWQATFPDGGGPIGAVDEVLSARAHQSHGNILRFIVHYREE